MGHWASDIETTGLLEMMRNQPNPRLHNFGFVDIKTGKELLFTHDPVGSKAAVYAGETRHISKLNDFLKEGHTLYMHNGILFDGEALRLLGYDGIDYCTIIDTLWISYGLYPERIRHGLEEYGEEYGVKKPKIEDWENQTQYEYDHRVMQDCRIQLRLTRELYRTLQGLYYGNEKATYQDYINFLMMKAKHLLIAQNNPVDLDVERAECYQKDWAARAEVRTGQLASIMPSVPKYELREKPKKPFLKNQLLSATGLKWFMTLARAGEPSFDCPQGVRVLKEENLGNPGSHQQMKDWLFSLGWAPETFKYVRDKETGDQRRIPQVYIPKSDGKLDPDLQRLIKKHPKLEVLEGLGVLKHRITVVNGFLKAHVNGKIIGRAQGLTNTLRLKHKELVNLPSTRVWGGKELRSLLGAGEGYECMGSDQSSLEDRIKHHYQWPFDPEYVKLQMADGYDPHLQVCVSAGMLTEEQVRAHKAKEADYSDIRHAGKGGNYACQYGAGAPTIARSTGVDLSVAEKVHEGYWKLNWSIKAIADNVKVKIHEGQKYLYNPVNGFYYFLKADKDKFSTLCQGTGAWVFDTWVEIVDQTCLRKYKQNAPLMGQWHDEGLWRTKLGKRKIWEQIIADSIVELNQKTLMNRDFASTPSFGNDYSEVH